MILKFDGLISAILLVAVILSPLNVLALDASDESKELIKGRVLRVALLHVRFTILNYINSA